MKWIFVKYQLARTTSPEPYYLVGQDVLGGSHSIHLIQADDESYKPWIQKDEEVFMWKEFRKTLPISLEFNINF